MEFEVINKAELEKYNVCANCNKQLNVTPIYCIERNFTIKNICGRCVNIADGIGKPRKWRQYVMENFGKFIMYPCSNKKFGCDDLLHWDDVVPHEKICTFLGVKCPLTQRTLFPNETCIWEGRTQEFQEHIERLHKTLLVNSPQIDWDTIKEDTILFTSVANQIITILIKYERENVYNALLMMNGTDLDSQCYRYQLELFDKEKNNSIILRKTRLEPLNFMMENLRNYDKLLEIDLLKVSQMLKSSEHLTGRFGIVKKSKKEIVSITGNKDFEISSVPSLIKPNIDEKLLLELECPVCNDHMVPPIHMCKTGHSICNACVTKVRTCPNCRDAFSGARNFTLEKLTTKVNYPCRNRELGCGFITTSDKIQNHHALCKLSENKCVLKCGWMGLRHTMYDHLKLSHPNSVLDTETLHIYDITGKNELVYFLGSHGELFRFSIKQDSQNSTKKFNMKQFGLEEGDIQFCYQLQIIDHSAVGLNLSFTNVVGPLDTVKTAPTAGLTVTWPLLLPFIFETHLFYFKVSLTRVKPNRHN